MTPPELAPASGRDRMGGGPAAAKAELRARLAAHRRRTPAAEREQASQRAADNLIGAVEWPGLRSIHVYVSQAAWGELDTRAIIVFSRERWPAIEVVSPTLAARQPVPSRPFDLIVVPVLGFDDGNNRLGLGAGFYDRFLAGQPRALKIGLAYSWARLPHGLPREPHDVPLDRIITDE